MFFEAHHSTERNYFRLSANSHERDFPLHIHRAFECYAVRSGSATATINGEEYSLMPGDAVLIFPYQRHEYKTEPGSEIWVCIFSPDLVGSFNKSASFMPKCNKFAFTPSDALPQSVLLKKALCYGICGKFDDSAEYVPKKQNEDDVLTKILIFVSKNYTSNCTLSDAANHVGYDYSYISKLFKRLVGTNFNTYVNGLRIAEACRLLLNGGKSVQAVAEECGFGCTRTFNREFVRAMGVSPSEFVKK